MTGTRSGWHRPAATLVGVVVVYFTVPGRLEWSDSAFVLSVLAMLAGTVLLAWAITSHVRRQLRGDADDLQSLVMLLALVLVVFAFGFYALERADPGQVSELRTRIDAFYFTLATMATVGYGDVHASGQVARALVAAQMTFNIVFVGALAAVLTGRVRIRAQERERERRGSPTGGDVPRPPMVAASASTPSRTTPGGAMATVDSIVVDKSTREALAALVSADPTQVGESGEAEHLRNDTALDPRAFALVRLASLVGVEAPAASYRSQLRSAVAAGVTVEEILDVLRAMAPQAGVPRVAAAAGHVMTALDLASPGQPMHPFADEHGSSSASPRSPT
jgi:voltage-gated potassium channel